MLRTARFVLITLAVVLALPALAAGPVRLDPPKPDGMGSALGTWFRVEPGQKQMFQVRHATDGKTYEVRLVWSTGEGFEFDSGWKPRAEFHYRGFEGTIDLPTAPGSDGALFTVRYRREQDAARGAHLSEIGDAAIYNADRGRLLVWLQDGLTVRLTADKGAVPEESTQQRLWIFQRAARRLIEWDEIPW